MSYEYRRLSQRDRQRTKKAKLLTEQQTRQTKEAASWAWGNIGFRMPQIQQERPAAKGQKANVMQSLLSTTSAEVKAQRQAYYDYCRMEA